MVKKLFRKKVVLLGILLSMFFSAASAFAGNPITFLNPSSNILDPGSPNTSWGGCGPFDSHCYVVPKKSNLNIPIPKNTETKKVSTPLATINNQTLLFALRNLLSGGLPADILAKLKGPKGDAGLNGTSTYIPATYIAPNTSTNYGGGSLFGATDLSAQNFITTNAKITTLNVTGNTDMGGSLNVVGNSSFHGALSLENNFSQTGSNTFSTGTGAVNLNGATSVNDILNVTGRATFTKVPTLAHAFTTWPLGTSNVSDASVYINPASADADTNIFGVAVNGNVKFLVDAEGDVYANNLILQGSVTSASNTIGTLNVTDNTTLGDAGTDTVTINANTITFNNDTNFSLPGGVNGLSFDTDTLSIDALNNRVGIGINSPAEKLDVNGNINITSGNNLKFGTLTYLNGSTFVADNYYNYGNFYFYSKQNVSSSRTMLTLEGSTSRSNFPTGNLGIGDAAPASKLSVVGNMSVGYTSGQVAPTNGMLVNGNVGIGTTAPQSKLHISDGYLRIDNDSTSLALRHYSYGNELFRIENNYNGISYFDNLRFYYNPGSGFVERGRFSVNDNSFINTIAGNLGVGTTAPGTKLDVVGGSIRTDNQLISTVVTGTAPLSVASTTMVSNLNADLLDGQHGSYYAPLGNISGTTNYISKFTGTNSLGNSLIFDNGTNVGIGTTTPSVKLDVEGDVKISGVLSSGSSAASGYRSVAIGNAVFASGASSFAAGFATTSSNTGTVAMGDNAIASGYGAVAIGNWTTASGTISFASGQNTIASGGRSTTMGYFSTASGDYSTAMGNNTIANSYNSFAIGRYNVGGGTASSWVATDPLFEIGIGTGTGVNAANAITVLKNGNVGIGTTSPQAILDIYGNLRSSTNNAIFATNNLTINNSVAGASLSLLQFTGNNVNLTAATALSLNGSTLNLNNINSGNVIIANAGGKVGIGTTSPVTKGHILGTSVEPSLSADNGIFTVGGSTGVQIQMGLGLNSPYSGWIQVKDTNNGGNSRPLLLNPISGNVGIGTTSPGRTLEIAGSSSVLATIPAVRITDTSGNVNARNWEITNGVSSYGALQFRISSAKDIAPNTNILLVDASGNVGIGTTSPGQLLHLTADSSVKRWLRFENTKVGSERTFDILAGTTNGLAVYDNTAGAYRLTIGPTGGISVGSYYGTDAGAGNMIISGNVGIGTTSPGGKLNIVSAQSTGTGILNLSDNGGANNSYLNVYNNPSAWVVATSKNGTGVIRPIRFAMNDYGDAITGVSLSLETNGNVGIGTTAPISRLDIRSTSVTPANATAGILNIASTDAQAINKGGSISFGGYRDDAATEFRVFGGIQGFKENSISTNNAGYLSFMTNSNSDTNERMRITSTGNIGIGTTAPRQQLSVGSFLDFYSGGNNSPTQPSIRGSSSNNLIMSAMGAGALYLNYDSGTGGIRFHGGTGVEVGNIDSTGNFQVDGYIHVDGVTNSYIMGNVGIGTTAPGYKFDLTTSDSTGGRFQTTNSAGAYLFIDAAGGATADAVLGYQNSGTSIWTSGFYDTDDSYRIAYGSTLNTNPRITIDTSGNVGIGTTAPGYPLTVNGDVDLIGSNRYLRIGGVGVLSSDGSNTILRGTTNQGITLLTNATEAMRITSAGNVGIGTTAPGVKLDVNGIIRAGTSTLLPDTASGWVQASGFAIPNGGAVLGGTSGGSDTTLMSIDSNNDSNYYAYNKFHFFTAGPTTERLTILNNGNVGIGTTAPAAKLNVVGSTFLNTTSDYDGSQFQVGGSILLQNGSFFTRTFGTDIPVLNFIKAKGTYGAPTALVDGDYIGFLNASGYYGTDYGWNKVGILYRTVGNWSATSMGTLMFFRTTAQNSTSETVRMTISDSGNVGIGTTAPGNLLTLEKSSSNYIDVRNTGGTNNLLIGAETGLNSLISRNLSTGAIPLRFMVGTTESMRIDNSGNVGIGTTAPTQKFVIEQSTNADVWQLLKGFDARNSGIMMGETLGAGGAVNRGFDIYHDGANNLFKIDAHNNADVGTNVLTITRDTGNVGIGTTAPGAKLDVNGGAIFAGNILPSAATTWNLGASGTQWGHIYTYNETVSNQLNLPGSGIWNSTGNVGIGTTSPGYQLEIKKSGGSTLALSTGDTAVTGVDLGTILFQGIDSSSVTKVGSMIRAEVNSNWAFGESGPTNLQFFTRGISSFDNTLTSPRMVIDFNGNVGVGTSSPGTMLHINQTPSGLSAEEIARFSVSDDTVSQIGFTNASSSNSTFAPMLWGKGSGTVTPIKFKGQITTDTGTNPIFSFVGQNSSSAVATRPIFQILNYTTPLVLVDSVGNVGIGTTNPISKLEISGTTGSYSSGIGFTPSGTGARNYRTYIDTSGSFNIDDATSAATRLTISSSGNVGIGTTAPASKLSVIGNIDVSGTVDGRDVSVDGSNLDTLVNPLGENIAEVIYIDTAGNDANDGLTWGTAKLTVQAAVNLIPKNLKGKTYILAMHPGTYETNGSYIELRNKMNGEIRFQTFSQTLNAGVSDESVFFRGNATNPIRDDTALVVLRGVNSRVFSSRDENVWLANSSNLTISFVGVNYEAVGKDATQYYYLDHPFTLNSTGNNALFNMGQTQKLVIAPSGVTFDATNNTKSSDWVDVNGTKVIIYALNIIGSLTNGSTTGTAWNSGVFLAGSNLDLTILNVQHWEFIYYGKTTIAETKSYVFSGIRNIVKSLSNASYGTAKININLAPRNGNENVGLGLSYTQGVLPDAALPKIDLKYNTTGNVSVPNTFAELITNNESDILFESSNTVFGRVMPIPTTDPLITGAIWNNNGMIRASGSTNPIYLDSSGNVGIGTTVPSQPLEVMANESTTGIPLRLTRNVNTVNYGSVLEFALNNSSSARKVYASTAGGILANTAGSEAGYLLFKTIKAGTLTEQMRIDNNGNVGIGTTAPGQLLHIRKDQDAATKLFIDNAGVTSSASKRLSLGSSGTEYAYLDLNGNSNKLTLANISPSVAHIYITPGTGGNLIIDSGNVGIGTTAPSASLTVVRAGTPQIAFRDSNVTGYSEAVMQDNTGGYAAGFGWGNSSANWKYANTVYLKSFRSGSYAPMKFMQDNGAATKETFVLDSNYNARVQEGNLMVFNSSSTGAEKVTNGTFETDSSSWTVGAGWSYDGVNKRMVHTAGNTAALEQNISAVAGGVYSVVFTVTNSVGGVGSVTVELGGVTGEVVQWTYTSTGNIVATTTGNLRFIPSTDWNGTIDTVSVKPLASGNIKMGGLLTALDGSSGLKIDSSGNVGIGTTAPSAPFEVKGTGTGVTIAKFTDVNTTGCTLATGGTISCSSDVRLKKNIEDISYGLETLLSLRPVLYNWNYEVDGSVKSLGFIAQEVESIIPKLVSTDNEGMKSLNTTGMIPMVVKSIQELNLNLSAVSGIITPLEGSASETFVKAFFDNVYSKMRTWFASAENGIEDFYANRMRAKELCIGDESGETCITKTQLDTLLANAGMSATSSSSSQFSSSDSSSGDNVAPVITLNGEATINLNVGDTYNEEGASAVDDVDGNVAMIISGNVDTSTNGIYTITYSASDGAGNNTTLTRTVNVGDVSSVSTPTPEPTPEPAPVEEIAPVSEPAPVPAL